MKVTEDSEAGMQAKLSQGHFQWAVSVVAELGGGPSESLIRSLVS